MSVSNKGLKWLLQFQITTWPRWSLKYFGRLRAFSSKDNFYFKLLFSFFIFSLLFPFFSFFVFSFFQARATLASHRQGRPLLNLGEGCLANSRQGMASPRWVATLAWAKPIWPRWGKIVPCRSLARQSSPRSCEGRPRLWLASTASPSPLQAIASSQPAPDE